VSEKPSFVDRLMDDSAPVPAPRRPFYRNPWLWAFVAGALLLTAIRPLLRHVPEPPPILHTIPAYTLVDQDGKPYGSEQLRGKPYVVSFYFTRCTSICPLLMRSMKRLQDEYEAQHVDGVHLVSVSVDPEYDRPEQLAEYAKAFGVHPGRWTLLTGEPAAVREVAENGFKVPMGTPEPTDGAPDLIDIAHTGRLVLVDAEGRVRGYYDTSDLGLEEIFQRSKRLLSD